MTKQHDMISKFQTFKNTEFSLSLLRKKLKEYSKKAADANTNCRKIEDAFHSQSIQLAELQMAFDNLKLHNFKLEERIKESVMIIKDVIGVSLFCKN